MENCRRVFCEVCIRLSIRLIGKEELDVASISYNIKDYYEEPKPKVIVHTSNIVLSQIEFHEVSITGTLWDGEGLVYLAQPATVKVPAAKQLVQVAN
ncbi:hypothetical protein UCDDA912_g05569 [Diaporthe ampelina]|uniref:Uncharacterized protein n=1 Tax=Diaporthe ampelina TaxID=1214573 RepID=A0A0G2I3B3_9PEZI|nr:hypothetical protein UCDDA912_g05569 [Diaporthe ampelina]